jgi:hypothetical protein
MVQSCDLPPEIQNEVSRQYLQAFLESQRHELPSFEVRYFDTLARHWKPCAWDNDPHSSCTIADILLSNTVIKYTRSTEGIF